MTELKPCPFCKSEDVEISAYDDRNAHGEFLLTWHVVICNDCAGHGPSEYTEKRAAQSWNRRATDIGAPDSLPPEKPEETVADKGVEGDAQRAEWEPTHKHRKGGLYRVVGTATMESNLEPVMVYEAQDRTTWIRPCFEFYDGRFTPLNKSTDPLPIPEIKPKAGA